MKHMTYILLFIYLFQQKFIFGQNTGLDASNVLKEQPSFVVPYNSKAGYKIGRIDMFAGDLIYYASLNSSHEKYIEFDKKNLTFLLKKTPPRQFLRVEITALEVPSLEKKYKNFTIYFENQIIIRLDRKPQNNFYSIPESLTEGTEIFTYKILQYPNYNSKPFVRLLALNNQFKLNSAANAVLLNKELDAETKQKYEIQLEACINHDIQCEFLKVSLVVTDVDEYPLEFVEKLYSIKIHENLSINSLILTVQAKDHDVTGILNPTALKYKLKNDSLGIFRMDQNNGDIYLAKKLDYESKSDYKLEVFATNGIDSAKSMLHIQVLNVNDNPPTFINPKIYGKSFKVYLNQASSILKLKANDTDQISNDNIRFRLNPNQGQNVLSLFSINAKTGELFIKQAPANSTGTFTVIVETFIKGFESLNTSLKLKIKVLPKVASSRLSVIFYVLLSMAVVVVVCLFLALIKCCKHKEVTLKPASGQLTIDVETRSETSSESTKSQASLSSIKDEDVDPVTHSCDNESSACVQTVIDCGKPDIRLYHQTMAPNQPNQPYQVINNQTSSRFLTGPRPRPYQQQTMYSIPVFYNDNIYRTTPRNFDGNTSTYGPRPAFGNSDSSHTLSDQYSVSRV